jgi:hypothetical protein
MVDLQDAVVTLIARIYENSITRSDLLSIEIMCGGTSLSLDGQDVFVMVMAIFEDKNPTPVYTRIFVGSQKMIIKKGKDLGESLGCHGEIYHSKATSTN